MIYELRVYTALPGRMPGPAHDRLGVPGDVADAGVDLVEGES